MIYTSSRVYFHIKNPFSISFIQIKWVLDWVSFSKEHRGSGAKFPRLGKQSHGRQVDYIKTEGLF
jgi:hypothetical protein